MIDDFGGYAGINDGHGATNSLKDDALAELIINTCRTLYDVLTDHCGPYASDTLVIQDNDARNLKDRHYAIFTKDGINIVRSLEFLSPIQRHVQNLVAYIGTRVDSLSHDGTTTSMMFFIKILERLLTAMREDAKTENLGTAAIAVSRRKYQYELKSALALMLTELEDDVITVEQLAEDHGLSHKEAIRYVAYQQAMVSSKGDQELTDALVEVVTTLPPELYGLFRLSQSGIETEKRFTVLHDEFNFALTVLANIDDMNTNMGTEFLSDSCDLIISEDDLVQGNPATEVVLKHITDAVAGTLANDLVILCKSLDSRLYDHIKNANRRNTHKITVFTVSVTTTYSSKSTMMSAIMNTAGVYTMHEYLADESLPYLIKGAKLHYKNRRLYISNLYQKDGSLYHPFFTNPERFPPYTAFVTDIREHLNNVASGRIRTESQADRVRYEDYVEILRRMVCAEVCDLQISGMTHDVLADRDVLQDTYGAVLSSLEHGFVMDGYLKFYLRNQAREQQTTTQKHIAEAVLDILRAVHKLDAELSCVAAPSRFDGMLSVCAMMSFGHDGGRYVNFAVDEMPNKVVISDAIRTPRTIIQPANTYRELLRRCSDLMPKMINTTRAIIPGTMNRGDKS